MLILLPYQEPNNQFFQYVSGVKQIHEGRGVALLFTSCGSACFFSTFYARNYFFTVFWLCFFGTLTLTVITFSWLKSIEKLKPVVRDSENLKAMALQTMCLVNSMHCTGRLGRSWSHSFSVLTILHTFSNISELNRTF